MKNEKNMREFFNVKTEYDEFFFSRIEGKKAQKNENILILRITVLKCINSIHVIIHCIPPYLIIHENFVTHKV